jgi:hypothetical protein
LDTGTISSIYARLVTVDEDSNIIRLVYYTTHDYLKNNLTTTSSTHNVERDIIRA